MGDHRILKLTGKEAETLALCLAGEIESTSGDPSHGDYPTVLLRILRKLKAAKPS